MSLEKSKTGDKPNPYPWGEGRREQARKQSQPVQRSGGVSVDSTSGSEVKVNWENSGDGNRQFQDTVQAGHASKAKSVAGAVGVPHSSVDLHYFKRCKEPRGDTYAKRRGEAKDAGMAGATRIVTPDKVRQLQIALYRKAKASPKYRFWSLYGELLRMDVLERALEAQFRNDGGGGVDGESLAAIKPRRRQWLERTKRWLTAKGLKLNEVKTRVVDIRQEGINFLGFSLTWRKSRQGRGYLHVEPSQKSRTALQEHLRDILNHWTQWKPIAAVVGKVNEVLRGWSAYFHFRNSSSVMGTMKRYSQNRFRRWLWRKQGCKRGLWSHYTAEKLHTHYGLMVLPTTAAWKAAR